MARGPEKSFDPDVALERAMDLFWERGYAATGMADLLEHMGIARKSLYDTFGNKQELFLKVVARYAHREVGQVQDLLRRNGSPLENIRAVFRLWQTAHGGERNRGCLLGTNAAHFGPDEPQMMSILRDQFLGLERAFCQALRRAQDAGELHPEARVTDLARLLVAAAQGTAIVSRTRDDGTLARSVARAALDALPAP